MTPQQPSQNTGVWPPPPQGMWPAPPTGQQALALTPFKTMFTFVQGSVPNFRVGTLQARADGVQIEGMAVLRYETQVPILIAAWILSLFVRFSWLIAYLAMEYGFRKHEYLFVPWQQVRQVLLQPRKNTLCVVYDAPNYKGVVKTFSLCTRVDPAQYAAWVDAARTCIPDRVGEGKLRRWTSPRVWIVLAGLLISLAVGFTLGLLRSLGTSP